MQRGQASSEALLAVVILMFMFTAFLVAIDADEDAGNAVAAGLSMGYECERVAGTIDAVYAAGSGTKTAVSSDLNVVAGSGYVRVSEAGSAIETGTFCRIRADTNGIMQYASGNFEVENSKGVVSLNDL